MGDTATSVNQGGASGSTGIQHGGKQMRVRRRRSAPRAGRDGGQKLGVAGRQAHRHRRRRSAPHRAKKASYGELIGGQILQRPARLEQADRQRALRPRQGQAEGPEGAQDRRQADPARGHRAEGVRAGGLQHRRQSAGHGARPHDPPGGRRQRAGQGRRKLDQGHPGRQGGVGQGLPRRRRRQGMGRDQGRRRSSRSSGRRSKPPFPDQAALYDHIRKTPARKREVEASRSAMSMRRSRPPPA